MNIRLHLAISHWQNDPTEERYASALQEWVKYEEGEARKLHEIQAELDALKAERAEIVAAITAESPAS